MADERDSGAEEEKCFFGWAKISGNTSVFSTELHRDLRSKRMHVYAPEPFSDREISGYLFKKGGGTRALVGRRNWKKRYFVVKDNILRYYNSEEDYISGKNSKRNTTIDLTKYGVNVDPDRELDFVLVPSSHTQRTWKLRAEDVETKDRWLIVLRKSTESSVQSLRRMLEDL